MRLLPFCAAMLPVVAIPAMASAGDGVGDWYVTPTLGGTAVDDRRGTVDKDWLYGVRIGKNLSEVFNLELNLDEAQVRGRIADNLTLYGGSFDLLAVLGRSNAFAPYLLVGGGVVQNERKNAPDSTLAMAEGGVGALARVWTSDDGSQKLMLRPEFKVRFSDAGGQGKLRDYIATVGFQLSFGPPDAPARTEVSMPAPAPAPVVAAAPPPPPPPADTDGDGVIDPADQCPNTGAGVAVDAVGCPRQGSIVLEGIAFEVASDHLTGDSQVTLDRLAADLKKYPQLRIELQGHTDSSGSDAFNLQLSQKRAESVRDFLVKAGVPFNQLVAKGYGESQPATSNATAEGRTKNRRVVMFVVSNPGSVKVEGAGTGATP